MSGSRVRELLEASKCEKDTNTRVRMIAVQNVLGGQTVAYMAKVFSATVQSMRNWVKRFEERGVKGLRDLPLCGRPRNADYDAAKGIAEKESEGNGISVRELCGAVYTATGFRYTASGMRKILREIGFSRKRSVTYKNATEQGEVKKWRIYTNRIIACAWRDGFIPVMQDETICRTNGLDGATRWSPIRKKIAVRRKNTWENSVVYGAIAFDGSTMVLQYDRFDTDTVIKYVTAMFGRFGKILLIWDNAPQHKSKKFREFAKQNAHRLRLLYLPVARPELNCVEVMWHRLKLNLLVGRQYDSLAEMRRAIGIYFATMPRNLDPAKFLLREITP